MSSFIFCFSGRQKYFKVKNKEIINKWLKRKDTEIVGFNEYL